MPKKYDREQDYSIRGKLKTTDIIELMGTVLEASSDGKRIIIRAPDTLDEMVAHVSDLDGFNERIDKEVKDINDRIDLEVIVIDDRIDSEVKDINDRIDIEVGDLSERIDNEESARKNADLQLQQYIDNEESARMQADALLNGRVDDALTDVVAGEIGESSFALLKTKGDDTTFSAPMPIASDSQAGMMPASAYRSVVDLIGRMAAQEGATVFYPVLDDSLTDGMTHDAVQTKFIEILQDIEDTLAAEEGRDPDVVDSETHPHDYSKIENANSSYAYRWSQAVGEWFETTPSMIPIATLGRAGLTKSSEELGQTFTETDGTQSLNGWDNIPSEMANGQITVSYVSGIVMLNVTAINKSTGLPVTKIVSIGSANNQSAGILTSANYIKLMSMDDGAQVNVIEGAFIGEEPVPIVNKMLKLPEYPTGIGDGNGGEIGIADGVTPGLSINNYTNADKGKVANLPLNTNSELALKADKDSTGRMTNVIHSVLNAYATLQDAANTVPVGSIMFFQFTQDRLIDSQGNIPFRASDTPNTKEVLVRMFRTSNSTTIECFPQPTTTTTTELHMRAVMSCTHSGGTLTLQPWKTTFDNIIEPDTTNQTFVQFYAKLTNNSVTSIWCPQSWLFDSDNKLPFDDVAATTTVYATIYRRTNIRAYILVSGEFTTLEHSGRLSVASVISTGPIAWRELSNDRVIDRSVNAVSGVWSVTLETLFQSQPIRTLRMYIVQQGQCDVPLRGGGTTGAPYTSPNNTILIAKVYKHSAEEGRAEVFVSNAETGITRASSRTSAGWGRWENAGDMCMAWSEHDATYTRNMQTLYNELPDNIVRSFTVYNGQTNVGNGMSPVNIDSLRVVRLVLTKGNATTGHAVVIDTYTGKSAIATKATGTTWLAWRELLESDRIVQTTGTSTSNIMSQKAVTDQLDTKINRTQAVYDVTTANGTGTALDLVYRRGTTADGTAYTETKAPIPVAVAGTRDGLMLASDKTKLNNVPTDTNASINAKQNTLSGTGAVVMNGTNVSYIPVDNYGGIGAGNDAIVRRGPTGNIYVPALISTSDLFSAANKQYVDTSNNLKADKDAQGRMTNPSAAVLSTTMTLQQAFEATPVESFRTYACRNNILVDSLGNTPFPQVSTWASRDVLLTVWRQSATAVFFSVVGTSVATEDYASLSASMTCAVSGTTITFQPWKRVTPPNFTINANKTFLETYNENRTGRTPFWLRGAQNWFTDNQGSLPFPDGHMSATTNVSALVIPITGTEGMLTVWAQSNSNAAGGRMATSYISGAGTTGIIAWTEVTRGRPIPRNANAVDGAWAVNIETLFQSQHTGTYQTYYVQQGQLSGPHLYRPNAASTETNGAITSTWQASGGNTIYILEIYKLDANRGFAKARETSASTLGGGREYLSNRNTRTPTGETTAVGGWTVWSTQRDGYIGRMNEDTTYTRTIENIFQEMAANSFVTVRILNGQTGAGQGISPISTNGTTVIVADLYKFDTNQGTCTVRSVNGNMMCSCARGSSGWGSWVTYLNSNTIVQATGTSTSTVMSQGAVNTALNGKQNSLNGTGAVVMTGTTVGYVPVDTAGGTGNNNIVRRSATSQVQVPTTPVATTDASSKSYVDTEVAKRQAPLNGTGAVVMAGTTPSYVAVEAAGGSTASNIVRRSASNQIQVPATPSATTDATSKSYVDSKYAGGISRAGGASVQMNINTAGDQGKTILYSTAPTGTITVTGSTAAVAAAGYVDMETRFIFTTSASPPAVTRVNIDYTFPALPVLKANTKYMFSVFGRVMTWGEGV